MQMYDNDMELFIKQYVEDLRTDSAAIFAGAGFSKDAGYVDWKMLIKDIAKSVGLDVEKEKDLVSVAQYNCNENKNRSAVNNAILKEFSRNLAPTENHRILARLPIHTIWTTNYDHLIEDAMRENYRVVDVKYRNEHMSLTVPNRDCIIYKMHGDKENPSEAVLIKDDYEKYYMNHKPFLSTLEGDLISKTFLFVGFSFTDPNLDYILSRVRVEYGDNDRQHYAIMRELKRNDYNSDADYDYAVRRNELFLDDLKRYKIKPLIVKEYSDLTSMFYKIEKSLNVNNVFISGSATEYGDFDVEEAEDLIRSLSQRLISDGYNVISGFGLGVGSHVITGALEEICKDGARIRNERLLLRPFPQGAKGKNYWKIYRDDMISRAGVSIFIFGNKKTDKGTELASGMKEEFEIAKEKGNLLIPIGCTGYMAQEFWRMINSNMKEYYPDCSPESVEMFSELNIKNDTDTIIENIMHFLELMKGD